MKHLMFILYIFAFFNVNGQQVYPLRNVGDWNIYLGKGGSKYAYRIDSATVYIESSLIAKDVTRVKYYSLTGSILSFADYTLNQKTGEMQANGRYGIYNPDGYLDTLGVFKNGIRDGIWFLYNKGVRPTFQIEYENGKIVSTKKLEPTKKKPEKNGIEEARYQSGGINGWSAYIATNVKAPYRYNNLPENLHRNNQTASAQFIIDTTGKISDVFMLKSVEWSMDKKICDVILNAPTWKPAYKNGRPIEATRVQPIKVQMLKTTKNK